MPRFHFHLRARGQIHRDLDGAELPDVAAARAHATAVAEELMRHAAAGTRHWSLRVHDESKGSIEDESGERQFDLYFADVDPSLASYSPQMRLLVGDTCRRLGALTDALCAAHATRIETLKLLARARGRPQLAYARGE
jgi:uncharacterized protein DUF6894